MKVVGCVGAVVGIVAVLLFLMSLLMQHIWNHVFVVACGAHPITLGQGFLLAVLVACLAGPSASSHGSKS